MGKYTQFAPVKSDKNDLMNKLFKNENQYNVPPGDEVVIRKTVYETAKAYMYPLDKPQMGDINIFPKGVNLNFSGVPDEPEKQAPNQLNVKWTNPGDPANGYFPDITSPGPGKTTGIDKSTDPKISPIDIKPNL